MRRALLLVLLCLLCAAMALEAESFSFVQALELAEKRSEILMLQASAVKR